MGGGAIFYVLLLFGLAFIPAKIASGKGYSFGGFYVFGLFFFIPALIVALVLEDKIETSEKEERLRKEIGRLEKDISALTSSKASGDILRRELIDPVCRQCGHHNEADTKFCTKCGAMLAYSPRQEEPVCPKCRAKVTAGDEFCGSCGWNLTEKEPEAVLISAVNGEAHCPVCGAAQKADRLSCFKCGAQFEYST